MRFESLEIGAFGALRDRSLRFDGQGAIIYGSNEAGKSQVCSAMRTVLFGFDPPDLAKHPARPVDGAEAIALEATLLVSDERGTDSRIQVQRTLDRSGANETLDPAAGLAIDLSASAYDDLFVIGPDEMAMFHASPSAELRRLILGDAAEGPGVDQLRARIDAERARLWRPDRRSKRTAAVRIDTDLKRVATELKEVRALERTLIALEQERASHIQAIDDAKVTMADVAERRARLQLIERVARAMHGAQSNAAVNASYLSELEDLPPPGPIIAELDAAEEACTEPRARLETPAIVLSESDARAVQLAAEIDALANAESEWSALVSRADELQMRATEASARAQALGRAGAGAAAMARTPNALLPAIACGVVAAALAYVAPSRWLAAAAALLGCATVWLTSRRWSGDATQSPSHAEAITTFLAEAESQAEGAASARQRAKAIESDWEALCNPVELAPTTGRGAAAALRERLNRARRAADASERDAVERAQAERELERAESRAAKASARFEHLSDALRRVIPTERSVVRAYDAGIAALRLRQHSEGALAEIAADATTWSAVQDDERFKQALASGTFDDDALRRANVQLASLEKTVEIHQEKIARIDERLASERPEQTASELGSERAALLAERDQVLRAHDRLALLSAVLTEGERRHRATHAPQLLSVASEMLHGLTAGRWGHLTLGPDDSTVVHVTDGVGTWPVAAPLSRGLREEIHLCLRLAALEIADDSTNPLPLLLDEIFAHWDANRRARGHALLSAVARKRQVILFTCHKPWADEAAAAMELTPIAI